MADKLFHNFGGEEIPLFTTFLPLIYHFFVLRISRVLSMIEGSGLNQGVCMIERNNFFSDNFFLR